MGSQQGESDPLAELARLIGQTDPFSDFGRDPKNQSQQAQPAQEPHDPYDAHDGYAEQEEAPAARPSWIQNLTAGRQPQRQEPVYREEDHYDPRYADGQYDPARAQQAPHFDHSGYAPLPAEQTHGQSAAGGDRYDDVLYGRPDHDPAHGYAQDPAYDDGYDRPPYDDGYEQDEPRARRGGMMTVVVVLLLAVVGTGAAFAYRTFVGSPRSGEPPVIKADAGPNKVVPAGSASDSSGKQIYDRVGDKSAERMVSREEQPVDVNAKTGPRVVFPPLTQNANPPSVANASMNTRPTGPGVGNGTLSGAGEEPRKISTLRIRPDQADAAAAAPVPAAPRAQAPAPVQRAAPASTASTAAPQANAPVSLSPQPAAAPEARSRVAALPPSAGTGGAYVQISSQKTEADAKASFKALQGKYSGILGSRSALIRRADIAGKGTFYRAMVGPFGTGDEATQFCVNLKSAGGQCVVQRN